MTAALPMSASGVSADGAGHLLDDGVAFRMHGGIVQRLPAAADPQEPGALLKRLAPQPRHGKQVFPAGESAVRVAMLEDPLGQLRSDPGNVAQELHAGGVQIDPHQVDARLDFAVQHLAELGLVDVVLVLADADRLGVDLDQLRQRVLQPPGDADRPAHGQVEVGKLRPGHVAGRVDRGPRFVHAHLGELPAA